MPLGTHLFDRTQSVKYGSGTSAPAAVDVVVELGWRPQAVTVYVQSGNNINPTYWRKGFGVIKETGSGITNAAADRNDAAKSGGTASTILVSDTGFTIADDIQTNSATYTWQASRTAANDEVYGHFLDAIPKEDQGKQVKKQDAAGDGSKYGASGVYGAPSGGERQNRIPSRSEIAAPSGVNAAASYKPSI